MATEPSNSAWQRVPELRGAHVLLEPLQIGHADGLRDAVRDGELWNLRYTNVPQPEQVDAYIGKALAQQCAGDALAFAVRTAGGDLVGTTRFYHLDPATPRLTIGYTWYAKRVQRTGLNIEAKLLLLTHAFETMGCIAVAFETSTENHASRTAIARLGARQDGVLRSHMRHKDGSVRDTVAFSILQTEWPSVKQGLRARLEEHRDVR
ncbi:GNAT family N-acetyltransferase [Lysobacter korlensis]|uniref:GNAT family N-acetyltransferase n=1 Tax=Lysobacter korlensis TaxID=553636 RepID=A0ABV6RLI6_9GAMM